MNKDINRFRNFCNKKIENFNYEFCENEVKIYKKKSTTLTKKQIIYNKMIV